MTTPVVDPLGDAYKAYEKAAEDYAETAFRVFAETIREYFPDASHAILEYPEFNGIADWIIEVNGQELSLWEMPDGPDKDALEGLEEYLRDNTPDFLETRPYSIVQPYCEGDDDFRTDRHMSTLERARMSIEWMLAGGKPVETDGVA